MHIVLGVLAIVGAVVFWYYRMRAAAEMTHELIDVADDVRAAVRAMAIAGNEACIRSTWSTIRGLRRRG